MVLAGLLVFSGNVLAERPPGAGGGGGGGGGGAIVMPDYGDLIKLYRDEWGVPYPSLETLAPDPETGEMVDAGLCWQPLAVHAGDETACPSYCFDGVISNPPGEVVVDVDQYTCGVMAGCAGCTEEVDFGRMNEARSPDTVFESQLDDVIVKLSTADCLSLDAAGRPVASWVEDDVLTSSAIDSPLQNLAIYRELMLRGDTGVLNGLLPEDASVLDTAARSLGAASDKSGGVNVDMVAYLNQIMGLDIAPTILSPPLCETYREEVQGVIQLVEKCFLNYVDYTYDREDNFGALPAPAYIPPTFPESGMFEYLYVVDDSTPTFGKATGPILDAVFCVDEDGNPVIPTDPSGECVGEIAEGYTDGNIGGFAQAADDTRAVIDFMHSNPLPEDYLTPVDCEASDDIHYDLSISEQSGLQVPKNYVSGGEREFFVNVTNLGPDSANGTVTVVATNTNGDTLLGNWEFTFIALPAGQTVSFTQYFTITTTSANINWNATVVADPPGTDPNTGNNSVDAVSKVRASGGGGH